MDGVRSPKPLIHVPNRRELALKERTSDMDEQSHSIPDNDCLSPRDLVQDQQQFVEWLAAVRSCGDARNRIAVSGDTVSRGVFGKFYLLVSDGLTGVATTVTPNVTTCEFDQSERGLAANDPVFDQRQAGQQ